jgi:CubicO group peptidase (beta-lactamase class C family)
MTHLKRLLSTACLILLVGTASAQPLPLPPKDPAAAGFSFDRLKRLHQGLAAEVDAGRYSGYIVLLARDAQIVDWRAYGWQDVEAQVPMQRDSILRIFSMSKIVTSVATLILLEEGKLRLGDPVEKFLPALANRQVFVGGTAEAPQLEPARRSVTIRDLLTHTAGYYYGEPWSAEEPLITLQKRAQIWQAENLDDFVARVAQVPLHEQPGTRYRYGINTDLLGAIVEKASGQRLDEFFQQRIFRPLRMVDTGFVVPEEKRSRVARIHHRGASGRVEPATDLGVDLVRSGPGLLSGGAGLYSTAGDYARFAQMLLNGGELDGARVLSRKTVQLMTQNHLQHVAVPHPFGIPSQGFGLGVRVVTNLGQSTVLGSPGMFGWDGLATTLVQIDPVERTVALLLCQHLPFNEDDLMATFTNGWYSALVE